MGPGGNAWRHRGKMNVIVILIRRVGNYATAQKDIVQNWFF
jgi:hypothetical protein